MAETRGCIYPNWEGGHDEGEHVWGKDGTCSVCGNINPIPERLTPETLRQWAQSIRDNEGAVVFPSAARLQEAARLEVHADAWQQSIQAERAISGDIAIEHARTKAQLAALQQRALAAERPWQACPVCGGRGNVMRGFYDGLGPKSSDGTTQELCRTCRGTTVIHLAALAREEKPG